ncbi:hypothetical protein BU26DRAFT_347982 [Trematosphaeria pertusa]|uniref:Uncharacterized protein n=1 Tax=Trematosphaeria pertusa TaxID=390896 RepID=A0A6A6ID52_9PLEO|nr:uncharacterized protein BU26DRAFT_347982 [Trematosphaeria pertusa]KAF2247433.1 hypothetical protein BU26DRAFT_347982 [Trematosphaeria pertusa]
MARTRAQAQAEKEGEPTSKPATKDPKPTAKKSKDGGAPAKGKALQTKDGTSTKAPKKRSTSKDEKAKRPAHKKQKTASPASKNSDRPAASKPAGSKIDNLIGEFGSVPLSDLGLKDAEKPTAETVLAHIYNALLSSGRIGHNIAHKTLQCLIDENYHDLESLKESTWERRTEVLTDGGYTHYREKTATFLGDLAQLIEDKYDGDAAKFLPGQDEAKTPQEAQKVLEKRLKEIKGLGPLGVEIFLGTIQTVYPGVAPYIGKRDMGAAKEMGLGTVQGIWDAVGKDNLRMGQLCAALTKVRLEGRTAGIK